jgi:hypothetical protein
MIQNTRQGYSIASWKKVAQTEGLQVVVMTSTPVPVPGEGGALAVVTTHMKDGYLQENGVPFSAEAVLTEYFNRIESPHVGALLVVTSIVDDPKYLGEPYVTTSYFAREDNDAGWDPSPCRESAVESEGASVE